MDIASIAGAATMMAQASSQEAISLKAMKQAADAQIQIANMLAELTSQPQPNTQYGFSVYA